MNWTIIGMMRGALRFVFPLLLLHPLQGQSWWLRDADDGARVIVETGVTCDLPGITMTIPLGMPIRAATAVKDDGETFYFGYPYNAPNSRCRVSERSTAVWHKAGPDSLLLAILDRALARKDATFEDLVAVENYLITADARWKTQAGREQLSGKLRFRWLQLITRAIGLEGFHEDQPLMQSWILSHGELMDRFDPSGEWFVPTRHFWQVYESNQTAPWAEELAWFVANLPVQHDECETTCILEGYIADRVLHYWTRFPSGPHVGEALMEASRNLRQVDSTSCGTDD